MPKDTGIVWRTAADGKQRPYVRLYINGKQRLFTPPQPTITSARALYQKLKVEHREGRLDPGRYQRAHGPLITDAIDAYMMTVDHKKTAQDEQRYATFWKAYFGPTRRLPSITVTEIESARASLRKTGRLGVRSFATVNRYIAWLRHFLNGHVRQGTITKNPAALVTPFKEPPPPVSVITPEMEQTIYAALGPYADWAEFSILTAFREGEQFGLRREWIDRKHGIIVLPDTKADEPQAVALSGRARLVLDRILASHNSPWVFPDPRDSSRHIEGYYWYNRFFKPAMKRAGVPVGRKHGVVWHTLRHTFGTRAALTGASEHEIMDSGRWKTPSAARRYVHLARHRVRDIMERVAGFAQAPAPTDEQPTGSSAGTGVCSTSDLIST